MSIRKATVLEGIRCCLQPRRQCDQCPYGVEDMGVECRSLLFCEVKAILGGEKHENDIGSDVELDFDHGRIIGGYICRNVVPDK